MRIVLCDMRINVCVDILVRQIIGLKGHNHAADWWSTGILIYELVNGAPPFQSNNPMLTYKSRSPSPLAPSPPRLAPAMALALALALTLALALALALTLALTLTLTLTLTQPHLSSSSSSPGSLVVSFEY